jgi:hypothetical protein
MKKLFFLLLGGFPFAVLAQSEVYFNQPIAEKTGAGRSSQELTLLQSGQLNQLQYRQTGVNNRVSVRQLGTQNGLDLTISGSDNQYSIHQQGDRNVMQWGAIQQNGGQLDLSQRGNSNQLIREGSSTAAGVSMRIEQSGGMQMIIKNGF